MDLPTIDHRLERIEEEMRGIANALQHLTRVDERLKQHRASIDDHEERLRSLEKTGSKAQGSIITLERVIWLVVTVGLALAQIIQ